MTSQGQPAFPSAAIDWLAPGRTDDTTRILVVGRASAPVIAQWERTGLPLVACAASRAGLRALLYRAPRALPVVALPTRLPFVPTSFDVVHVHQALHELPPAAIAEFARVLRPGGHLAVSYTIRDDTIPWVRRLTALMRAIDPTAMTGDYGTHSLHAVAASPFFAAPERRNHRLWIPIARVDLLDMVAHRFPELESDRLARLLDDVAQLYASSARVPEPLLLPYQVACWRIPVDHSEFTSQLHLPDDGLSILL